MASRRSEREKNRKAPLEDEAPRRTRGASKITPNVATVSTHERFMRRSADLVNSSIDDALTGETLDAITRLANAELGRPTIDGDIGWLELRLDDLTPAFGGVDPYDPGAILHPPGCECGARHDAEPTVLKIPSRELVGSGQVPDVQRRKSRRFKRIRPVTQFVDQIRIQYARDANVVFQDAELELIDFEEAEINRPNERKWEANVRSNVAADTAIPAGAADFLIAKEHGIPESIQRFWVKRNLSLIRVEGGPRVEPIPHKAFKELERTITQGIRAGSRPETIMKRIQHLEGVTERRAEVIARDQVVKQNGRMTQIRHKQMGARTYFWRTVGDGRVRERHEARNNVEFSYDNAPRQTPDDGHPGTPVQCRCWANANLRRALGIAA